MITILFPDEVRAACERALPALLAAAATRDGTRPDDQYMADLALRRDAETAGERAGRSSTDDRPVGMCPRDGVIRVRDLWGEAARLWAYFASMPTPWPQEVVRREKRLNAAIQRAEDARQCADDLGIRRGVVNHEDALREMTRVGLGGLIDAADMAPVGRWRRLGPQ